MDHREMATEWQQSGPFGQIKPVAKRTSTDAMVTDAWSEREGERLRVKKDRERERATELVSILHIIALVRAVKYSHSWNWLSRCSQLAVWWVVCVFVYMYACAHIVALTLVSA